MITQEEFIKKYNFKESDYYQENGWLYILNLRRSVFQKLPSKIEFTEKCNDILLEFITKIPSDVIFNNNGRVIIRHVKEISENVVFNNNNEVTLGEEDKRYNIGKFKKIHPSVKFTNNGHVCLYNMIKIPSGIVFNNKRNVYLYHVKEISKNVIFNNNGSLYFYELERVHSNVKIENGESVVVILNNYINSLPKGIVFSNKGKVEVPENIKYIPENVIFNNDGFLLLGGLEKVDPTVKFINKGDIFFGFHINNKINEINKIPKGIVFNNKGNVIISSNIKYISENVIFNNDGDVKFENQKVIFSKGVRFNNKGKIENVSLLKNIPEFLDSKKYLNKMIKQLYK